MEHKNESLIPNEIRREKHNARRRRWSKRNRDRQLETQREWYARDRQTNFAKIRERRKQANPTLGLYRAIFDCRNGTITVNELARRYREAFIQLDAIANDKRQ